MVLQWNSGFLQFGEEWTITATIHATTFKDAEESRNIISVSVSNFGFPKAGVISILL